MLNIRLTPRRNVNIIVIIDRTWVLFTHNPPSFLIYTFRNIFLVSSPKPVFMNILNTYEFFNKWKPVKQSGITAV